MNPFGFPFGGKSSSDSGYDGSPPSRNINPFTSAHGGPSTTTPAGSPAPTFASFVADNKYHAQAHHGHNDDGGRSSSISAQPAPFTPDGPRRMAHMRVRRGGGLEDSKAATYATAGCQDTHTTSTGTGVDGTDDNNDTAVAPTKASKWSPTDMIPRGARPLSPLQSAVIGLAMMSDGRSFRASWAAQVLGVPEVEMIVLLRELRDEGSVKEWTY